MFPLNMLIKKRRIFKDIKFVRVFLKYDGNICRDCKYRWTNIRNCNNIKISKSTLQTYCIECCSKYTDHYNYRPEL